MLTKNSTTYGIAEYWIRVQWQTPSNTGEVDNYTLNLSTHETVVEMSLTNIAEYHLMLNYSTNYSVIIYGSNCAGSGNSTSFHIFEGKKTKSCFIPTLCFSSAILLYTQLAVGNLLPLSMAVFHIIAQRMEQ